MNEFRERLERLGYGPVIKGDAFGPEDLRELPMRLGRELPSDYLQFLNECSTAGLFRMDCGVGIRNMQLGTDYGSDSFTIEILFARCSQEAYDLISIAEGKREFDDGLTVDYLRIGQDIFAHSFVMDLRPTSFGQVSFLDHTDSEEDGGPRLFLLAGSFRAFVALLEVLPDDD